MVTNRDAVQIDDPRAAVTVSESQPNAVTITLVHALSVGANILSGFGDPTVGIGEEGDFYIDRTAASIHGPKGVSTWPSAILGSMTASEWDAVDFLILGSQHRIRNGCAVTPGGLMTSDVAAGVKTSYTRPFVAAAATVAHSAANGYLPRYDLVGEDALGIAVVVEGTPARYPTYPALPVGFSCCSSVLVAAGATVLASGDYTDKRVFSTRNLAADYSGSNALLGLELAATGAGVWADIPDPDGNTLDSKPGGSVAAVPGQIIEFDINALLSMRVATGNTWLNVAIVDSDGDVIRRITPTAQNTGPIGWGAVTPQPDSNTDIVDIYTTTLAGSFPYVVEDGDLVDGVVHYKIQYSNVGGSNALLPTLTFIGTGGSWWSAKVYDRHPIVRFVHDGQSLNNTPVFLFGDDSTFGLDLRKSIRSSLGVEVDTRTIAASGNSFSTRTLTGTDRHQAVTSTCETNVLFSWGGFADIGAAVVAGGDETTVGGRTAIATTVVANHKTYITNMAQCGTDFGDRYDYVIALTNPYFGQYAEGSDRDLLFAEYNRLLMLETAFFDAIIDTRAGTTWALWDGYQFDGVHHDATGNAEVVAKALTTIQTLGIL
jgi:hypothetical protein